MDGATLPKLIKLIQEAGMLGGNVPFDLVIAQMAEIYGVLPTSVLESPVDETLYYWRIARLYDQWRKKRPKWVDQ